MSSFLLAALVCFLGAEVLVEPAHFHHVHLNVTDVKASMGYYERIFGAVPVRFNNKVDALFTERSFLLFTQVGQAPESALNTALWHIGWGGVDVASTYTWWKDRGVKFSTPLSPLPGKDNYYMYFEGPDKEVVEMNTMGHSRFGHVHLFAEDVNASSAWYEEHLGLKSSKGTKTTPPNGDPNTLAGIWMNFIQCDNVNIIIFGVPNTDPPPIWWTAPPLKEVKSTSGHVFDHLAFSYRDIAPVYQRMKAAGLEFLSEIEVEEESGVRSFKVMGPDNVVIEIVEAKPIPEGLWEDK